MTCRRDACAHWRNCDSISQQHCTRSWKNLVRLWRAQKLCDVVFVVDDERFLCHGIVPATTSAFIRKAFLKRIETSVAMKTLEEKEIIIDFITKDVFAQVLNFMYTAEIDVTSAKIKQLFRAGAKLEMQGLVDAILRNVLDKEIERDKKRDKIIQKKRKAKPKRKSSGAANRRYYSDESDEMEEDSPLGEEFLSVCGLIDDLRLQGDISTLALALAFAARNFGRICGTRSYLNASVHTVAALLDDDRLNMEEFLIFQALTKWLEARQMHLVHGPYLLSKVRLQLLTPEELTEEVESKDYLMRKKKSRVMILEAFRFHCLKAAAERDGLEIPEMKEQKERRGNRFTKLDSDGEDWALEEEGNLTKDNNTKTYCPILPCSCCPNYIITSGGIDMKDTDPSEGVYKYEEKDNRWTRFAKLQQPRNHHAAVYCKGYLYILGGSDPSLTGQGAEVCPVATCYRLGLESLTWTKIDPMSTPRMSLQAVYLNGYIYAIGGQDHKQRILRDIERYSIDGCVWEYAGALSSIRAGPAVCVHKNKIWTAGGYSHKKAEVEDVVEEYDTEFESWQDMCPLRFPRCFASLVDCLGVLYIIGGAWLDSDMECSNFSSIFDVDKYNNDNKIWEGITALKIGRHDCGYAVLGPRIYIVGGKHCDDGSIRNLDDVECYDVEKQDWIEGVSSLPIPLLGPAATYTN